MLIISTAKKIQGIDVSSPLAGFKMISAAGIKRMVSNIGYEIEIRNDVMPTWVVKSAVCEIPVIKNITKAAPETDTNN